MGLFINTLPVRLEVRGEEPVIEMMKRVQQKQGKVLEFEYSPLMEVQGWSEVPRGVALFEAIYIFQNYPVDAGIGEKAGAALRISEVTEISKNNYGMTVRGIPGNELLLDVVYDSGRYEAVSMERLLNHLGRVLEGMAENEESRVIDLPMLSKQERQQILVDWNQTAADYPRDRCVHELFEQQVKQTPDAVAVVYEGNQLTYEEINRRSNQLAHYLREMGVGPEVKVGLFVERSLEMVVGLLGVMKAGGVYLPLDVGYPPERLRFMIEDSEVAVVVTQDTLFEDIGVIRPRVLSFAAEWEQISTCAESNPEVEVSEELSAYVIYTSGTTGLPKGVQISHGALINFLHSMQLRPGFQAGDSLMAVTSLSFDIAGLELYLPLLSGGSIVLASSQTKIDGGALAEALATHRVTMMQATPTTWRMLLEAGWNGAPDLKILCGGEALPLDLAEELLPRGASL